MSTVPSFLRPLLDPGSPRGVSSSPYGSLVRGSFPAAGAASGGPQSHEVWSGTAILAGQASVLHRFPAQSAASPALWAMIPPRLLSGVGPGQPNLPSDVRLVQKLINLCMARGYLRAPIVPPSGEGVYPRIIESGVWGYATHRAIVNIEQFYFHGRANPRGPGIVSAGGTLFGFLVDLVRQHRIAEQQLAPEMSALAKAMLPDAAFQRIQKYLPLILDSLERRDMADTEMVLLVLATVYVETWYTTRFEPADEKVSAGNTEGHREPVGIGKKTRFVPTGAPFGRYTGRLQNANDADAAAFRGRGFTQLTGRENYTKFSSALHLGQTLVNQPELANDPYTAAEIIAEYFRRFQKDVRLALQQNDLRQIRKIVNGKDNGYSDFRDCFNRGRRFIGETMILDAMIQPGIDSRPRRQSFQPTQSKRAR